MSEIKEEEVKDGEDTAEEEKTDAKSTDADRDAENEDITGYIRTDDGVDDTPDIYEDPLEPKRRAALSHRHAAVAAIDAGEDEAAFNELVKAMDIYEETIMLGGNEQDIYVLQKTSGALVKLATRLQNRYTDRSQEAFRNMAAVGDDPGMKQGFFREGNDCRDKAELYLLAIRKYTDKAAQYG
ncbi:MAG: hypothetical protein K5686_11240 [Lachnospiraceae bacterium]|nr:hypothetical protein [Lachnospiraceae bacterium]